MLAPGAPAQAAQAVVLVDNVAWDAAGAPATVAIPSSAAIAGAVARLTAAAFALGRPNAAPEVASTLAAEAFALGLAVGQRVASTTSAPLI